jgi:hypothetical protein
VGSNTLNSRAFAFAVAVAVALALALALAFALALALALAFALPFAFTPQKPPTKFVILSEGAHSLTVSTAVEGPALALALAVAVALAVACSPLHHPQPPGAPFIATSHRDGWEAIPSTHAPLLLLVPQYPAKKKPSSRPKRRTVSPSVAQWRDPPHFALASAFVFVLLSSFAKRRIHYCPYLKQQRSHE